MIVQLGFQIRLDLSPRFYFAIEAMISIMKKAFRALTEN